MKTKLRLAAVFFVLIAAAARAQEPAPLTLRFDFFYNGIKAANVVETFAAQNGEYEIKSHAKAVGLAQLLYGDVVRKSAGRLDDGIGLFPVRYEQKRGKSAEQSFELAGQDGNVVSLAMRKGKETRTETVDLAETPVFSDYLTALYRPYVLGEAAAGRAAATNGWRLRIYEYTAGEPEKVQTPLGEIAAVPVSRESPRGARIFWLAPELNYIPVKVYINDKGHKFETVITEINGAGLP